jgi:hypothetical protein
MMTMNQRLASLCWASLLLAALPARAEETGLLGHWKFDEGQGDVAVDSSGNELDGDVWNADWVRGKFGTALRFDGQGSFVSVPEIPELDGSSSMTLEAWVYWEGAGQYPNIVSGGTWSPGGFMLFVNEHQCSFRMGRPGVSASGDRSQWRETSASLLPNFQEKTWYHLAATFQRPVIKTYVNGQPVGSAQWDYPVGHQNDLLIGKWAGAATHQGLIDEVRIFKRALTPQEVLASFQQQRQGRTPLAEDEDPYEVIPQTSQLELAAATFENQFATMAVSPRGRCTALIDKSTGKNHILRSSPLVSLKQGDQVFGRATCQLQDDRLVFHFPKAEVTVSVKVTVKPRYFVFQVADVQPPEATELTFLRLNLERCEHVQPMSGLAADEAFAVCLRTLNLGTRVQVGRNPPELTATAFQQYELTQGAAALVACPTPDVRPVLQDVVREEGLPFSALGGPFAQDAAENRGSYVFARVSESDVDQWIELARRGGIAYIHLIGWQQSLGHYEPRTDLFPNGLEGLKSVVEQLHDAGLKVGIHTLTGCISTNDAWVRPVPDPRLAADGTFVLATALDEEATSVLTADPPGTYPTVWAYSSRGNCLRIGEELIQYSAISNEPPYGFLNCKRGAFGTKAQPHAQGVSVDHVMARYGCFVPDEHSSLVEEVADAIAHVYNTCEIDQIYMDGAEAMRGWYGIARMRQAIYSRLQRPALVEASCWDHHSWPFHSRVGAWDHPKWGLKRFADDHLAAVEQYRAGCLLEAQLGWWVILGPARDWDMEMPDEIEYLCAKALANDVPLSFQSVSVTGRPANARQDEMIATIGQYERLRLANYFDERVKARVREERQEFHLEQAPNGDWQFTPTDYQAHKVTSLQNGTSTWTVKNRHATQPLKLRIQALYSAYPYDDEEALLLAEFTDPGEFTRGGSAAGVDYGLESVAEPRKVGKSSGRITATNNGDTREGAWARWIKRFEPFADMTPHDALGVWIHGDGKDELINLQLTNSPEYFRTLDDHYIKVDFEGWRYFELLMRERDAAAYHDYQWPYGAHCVLHRSPLVRQVVNQLTMYVNNLPPQQQATCFVGPIKALRTRKVQLDHPTIECGGKRLTFPVALESGMYIEYASPEDCRLYDERGELVQRLQPEGEPPVLEAGSNSLTFTCTGTPGFRSRVEVTTISHGAPLRGRRPDSEIDWSYLSREYKRNHEIHEANERGHTKQTNEGTRSE